MNDDFYFRGLTAIVDDAVKTEKILLVFLENRGCS